jgi:hypothetical protein
VGQEVEDVSGEDGGRILLDHAEERLQVEGDGPQGVGANSTSHELQIAVNEWMAKEVAILSVRRRGTDKAGEGGHPGTLPALRERHGDALSLEAPTSDLIR